MSDDAFTPDAHVLAMLTAFRETGLCADPDQLNRVWRGLTGWPRIGPCTRCSVLFERYGDRGHPLCPECRTEPTNGRIVRYLFQRYHERNDRMTNRLDFADLIGQQIPGGCDDCDAYQTMSRHDSGAWILNIHHDADCPFYASIPKGHRA